MMAETEDRKEYTLNIGKVNIYSFLMIVPIATIYFFPFIFIWDYETFDLGRKEFMKLLIFVFVFGIILHELLHGITWALFAKRGFRSIKFGINGLTPYCHCKEPLKVKHYRLGGMMPLLIMGIIPAIAGFMIGNE